MTQDLMCALERAVRRLPPGAAFSGPTAAWLHGLDVAPCAPIEANVPPETLITTRSGMRIRRCALTDEEVTRVRGLPAVSLLRAVAEVCSSLELVEGVVVADAALHARYVDIEQLRAWAESRAGRRGVRRLRRVLEHAEPASESPMESRLRMVLVLGGLPRPKAQVPIYDESGRFVGRPDLYYEDEKLGIEYDGGGHRDALVADDRRQNNLLRTGVRLLRFTAADVFRNQQWVVFQVREMLSVHTRHRQRDHSGARVHTRVGV